MRKDFEEAKPKNMTTTKKHIGLVAANAAGHPVQLSLSSIVNGYELKKVFVKGDLSEGLARTHYPDAEIVGDLGALLNDDTIDLVVVASQPGNDLDIVKEVLDAGKHVRII